MSQRINGLWSSVIAAAALSGSTLLESPSMAAVVSQTGVTGGSSSIDNRQPYLAITTYIRTTGAIGDVGSILILPTNIAPTGYLPADGRTLAISTNTDLFNNLNTTYGGNGTTSFRIPDLRGRVAVGGGGVLGDAGAVNGEKQITLTPSSLPAHNHSLPSWVQPGGTDFTGGSQPYSTVQDSLAMNYQFARVGAYPERSDGNSVPSPMVAEVRLTASVLNNNSSYIAASGGTLPINTNQSPFSVVGTTYGGTGNTTFGVPDLRGRVPVGSEGNDAGAGLTARTLGGTVGSTESSLFASNLPAHTHSTDSEFGGVTGSTGAAIPVNNMQPSLGLNYIIAMEGLFPSSASSDGTPLIGEIKLFAGDYAPAGYAFCAGQILPISTYSVMFTIFGNAFGGDGVTTFALPDLRGRTVLGAGLAADGTSYFTGQSGGAETYALSTATMPAHSHSFTAVPEPAGFATAIALVAPLISRRRSAR